jgi:hypothetical protein
MKEQDHNLVAAILAVAKLTSGVSSEGCVEAYVEVLQALAKRRAEVTTEEREDAFASSANEELRKQQRR